MILQTFIMILKLYWCHDGSQHEAGNVPCVACHGSIRTFINDVQCVQKLKFLLLTNSFISKNKTNEKPVMNVCDRVQL